MMSRFHISVAMMLATVAILAVPESAFADDKMDNCVKALEQATGFASHAVAH